jgi:lipopolysaccharide export system protein LptA
VAAYGAYSLFAVPWIEPEAVRPDAAASNAADRAHASDAVSAQRTGLRCWFQEGDWELTSPKILETSQGKLLLKDHERLDDHHFVKMKPCSIVLMPEGKFESDEERNRQAIVLRAPEAVLQFDKEFDLVRGDINRLVVVGAELIGKVTIHSQQRLPGPEDDLWVETRDVKYANDRIVTFDRTVGPPRAPDAHRVKFRQGPNQGEGRRLLIEMATPAEKANPAPGRKFGSVKRFELARDVRLRMLPGNADLFPSGPRSPPPGAAKQDATPQAPVEITCRGPFRFDLLANVATFNDHVAVVRLNPVAASDQLTCDVLDVYFEADAKPAAASEANQAPSSKLRPSRLTARGNPVVLNSPSNGVQARGQRLEYDVQNRAGKLFDQEDAFLIQEGKAGNPPQEIHARELQFESDPENPSGPPRKLIAKGKGWLKGNPPEGQAGRPQRRQGQFTARWTRSLTFVPFEEYRLLSLWGDAQVEMPGSGKMDAEQIHLYLSEVPAEPATPNAAVSNAAVRKKLVPAKLNALGAARGAKLGPDSVIIGSPQLDGTVNKIEVWFKQPAPAAPAPAGTAPAAAAPPPEPAPEAEAANPRQHFHVSGRLLQVNALLAGDRGGPTQITDVILTGEAACTETQTALPGEQPLVIHGDQLHLVQPQPENAVVTVTGQPATVDARGMRLEGGTAERSGAIHLHRGTNKLWVDGPGFLSLPADRDMSGRPLKKSANERLKIWWTGRMDFDGLAAQFERNVIVGQAASKLQTPLLHVDFSKQVRFGAGGSNDRAEVKRILCRQGVEMWNRSFDAATRQPSDERMKAQDLTYLYATGDIHANGPGWVSRVWVDTGESLAPLPGGGPKKPAPPRERPSAGPRFLYLRVNFQREMSGNEHRQVMDFHGQVRAIHGPVFQWNEELDPQHPREDLGQQGFVLASDRLQVAQMGTAAANTSALELTADGNAVVENSQYVARSSRLKYERGKDLLTLDGDGYSPARLFRQISSGKRSSLESRKIWFRPSTNDVKLDDFRSLDFNDLTSAKTKEPPK